MKTIDIAHLQSWVGRERVLSDRLDPFPARALAAMLDHVALPEIGAALPATWHWLYFLDAPHSAETADDGHPKKGTFLPPVPLPRRMWASGKLSRLAPLRIGTAAERRSSISSVELKHGKSGDLVFVEIEHLISQDGRQCVRERQTLVYRPMPDTKEVPPAGEHASENADFTRIWRIDPVLLFRYSALTYNAHRIHYDRDYTTRQEGYPGLVVHAPLLATLLLDSSLSGADDLAIEEVGFRAMRPTFDLAPIALYGKTDGRRLALWSTDSDQYVTMKVSARVHSP
jgi:3-methylfumaryl-CoA hydratase